jgi:hypothetical protein
MGIFLEETKNLNFKIFYKFFNLIKVSGTNVPSKLQFSTSWIHIIEAVFNGLKFTAFYFISAVWMISYNFLNFKNEPVKSAGLKGVTENNFPGNIKLFPGCLKNIIFKRICLITSLYSIYNLKYAHTWKTIFYYIYEKSNLLVRSDNNTGFSWPKALQTTTI